MKYLVLALLVTSCVTPRYGMRAVKPSKTVLDRQLECTYRLIEQSGIEAKKAQESCKSIFRGN